MDIKHDNNQSKKQNRFHNNWLDILYTVIYIIIICASYLLIEAFIIEPVRVNGDSMVPTLMDKQIVLVDKMSYRFKDIERFDIVVFKEDRNYVKRVIGLPGETVQIIAGVIYINNKPVAEYYGRDDILNSGNAAAPVTLSESQLFVMGDNRNDSLDSRSDFIGLVDMDFLLGKVCFRVFPLNAFGRLTNQ